jgi:pimeloyl-ACP methyl ester carboxylesterase
MAWIVVALLAAVVAAGVLYERVASARSARASLPPGVLTDVGGHRLHAVCRGTGAPVVVFEAGIAASSLSWTRVMPEVAAFTRVCAYDRAGLGWSDVAAMPRTFARIVAELGALLAAARLPPPYVLVGHSFGCFVACGFAARDPKAVAGLVLLDPPPASEWQTPDRSQSRLLSGGVVFAGLGALLARLGVVRACGALLLRGAPTGPRTFLRLFGPTATNTVERLVGEIGKLPADVHPIVHSHWSQAKCFRALADHLRVLREAAGFVAALDALPDVPLVVLSSGRLPPERIDEHRRLARLSSRGSHVTATRSGHWIQFDEPELVTAAIRQVLDDVRRQP